MHLLAGEAGSFEEGQAYDIQQTVGDIVILSHATSELTALAEAYKAFHADMMTPETQAIPTLRLMNLGFLGHPATIDAYCEQTLIGSKLVIVRLLGGQAYWQYGVDELRELCAQHDIQLILLAGDKNFDESLKHLSVTPEADSIAKIFAYFCAGGQENFAGLLAYLSSMLGCQMGDYQAPPPPPLALADDGIYRQFGDESQHGKICVLFYRALIDGGDIAPIDALCDALDSQGLNGIAYYANNFRDELITQRLKTYLQTYRPNLIMMATGFALAKSGVKNPHDDAPDIFENLNVPLLQIVLSNTEYQQWNDELSGLPMREIAMNVALTELDGRLLTRMIACRDALTTDPLTECPLARYHILPDRVAFVAQLARRYIALQMTPAEHKKLGFVLGNYPASDGRLANGVGLDTPQATLCLLQLAQKDGIICQPPADSETLMALLQAGPTNQHPQRRISEARLSLADYQHHFSKLPIEIQQAVNARWGEAVKDAFVQDAVNKDAAFHLPIIIFGNVAVGLQPSRGYELDPDSTCHDPSLPPPHGYFAFYIWLREIFGMHVATHIGKHGTLEWLPGKSLALSAECYPDAVLGAMPVIYPFICNDPGEGTQAKRRIQAVILDHLPPPLATGGLYDSLAELEVLLDEYYDARQLDVKRRDFLAAEMVKMADALKLEIGTDDNAKMPEKLNAIENFLCDIKFTMIRAGLHRYGELPDDLPNFLLNLLRHKRGDAPHQQSLLQSLADDLEFGFNPLEQNDFEGVMMLPDILKPYLETKSKNVSKRLAVEALHQFSLALITGDARLPENMKKTHSIISKELPNLRDLLAQSKLGETGAFIKAINGRYIASGASGAPSRGRLDILPTGRNFYSVDMRDIPSKAAWQLGMLSADLLLKTHLQNYGNHLQNVVISMWGTAQMRTGGEDIAQVMALMGVQPIRQQSRITGYQILPLSMLGRPRVDVTIRISGFFRDAFPNVIRQLSEMIEAVAKCDEADKDNPLALAYKRDKALYQQKGIDAETASQYACQRIFGAELGSYGAGLQHLIASGNWQNDKDFADIFLRWGGFAYNGADLQGKALPDLLQARLAKSEAVIHNQDNREHDILDSDDYYQFEGGLAASIRHFSGEQPEIYHNDHSNPSAPRIGTLKQEIARIIHARAANPKWIKAIMAHGYKGAFEIAATVEYLFAFAATAQVVEPQQFDRLFQAYVADEEVRDFIRQCNPQALEDMLNRFDEAVKRDLWRPHRNSTQELLAELLGG